MLQKTSGASDFLSTAPMPYFQFQALPKWFGLYQRELKLGTTLEISTKFPGMCKSGMPGSLHG